MKTTGSKEQPKNRQMGVTETSPEHLVLAALAFIAPDAPGCRSALEVLRGLIQAELEGTPASDDLETGELGFAKDHDTRSLMVTVGFSTLGYEHLGVAPDDRPRDLQPIPLDIVDSSGQNRGALQPGEGDLLLKICSDDIYVAEHVLRRVQHEGASQFQVVWAHTGVQRYNTRQAKNPRNEARALNGFLDGTNNLSAKNADDRALIFTDSSRTDYPPLPTSDQYGGAQFPTLRPPPSSPEPKQLDGGTYMAVEVMLLRTAEWDAQARPAQEFAIGRDKITGENVPTIDPSSHVLKANPGRPEDVANRILRRGYSLLQAAEGGVQRGLVFVAFGRTLSTQVEFIQRAWINNPNFPHAGAGPDRFMAFVEPQLVAGGFYFVPPVTKSRQPWSWVI